MLAALGLPASAVAQSVEPPPPPTDQGTTHQEIKTTLPPPAAPDPAPEGPPAREKVHYAAQIPLTFLRTHDLSLLYFDPAQTYLTPYIARSFENAIAFHERLFDWHPWDRTTVLLKDFSDYGNAAARSSPNNAVLLDIAPLSQSLETFTPGERFYTLINHELGHVATMDVWDAHDAGWRRFLHGKPMPIQEHPESIAYNYLATPRVNVPRWYLEGSAVMLETWMAGGLGRAQGAYDEMVFRAKVRDDARFYSPLGLEAEGTQVDFQVGVNDYLYGTRFFSYLSLAYSPERAVEWLKRPEGSAGYYATRFRQVFGKPLDDVWGDWIAWEHTFQRGNLDRLAKYPLTPLAPLAPRALGSISRTFYDPVTDSLIGAFRYPGVIGHVGVLSLKTGRIRRLHDIKGAMLYRVTSLAYDPAARTAYYTQDNYALRDVVAINVDTGQRRVLLRDARIGDLVVDPVDKAIWGLRHQNGFATLVRIPAPYHGFNQVYTFPYGQIPFDLDISPDGTLLSASLGTIDGRQTVRVWQLAELAAGAGPVEVARLELPPATPEGFVFAPDGKSLYGSAYYTGVSNIYRLDIASGHSDLVSNTDTGLFRPLPMADGSLIVDEYTGEGLRPARMTPQVREDAGNVVFLGSEVAREHPVVKTWGVGSPAKVPLDQLVTGRGAYVPRGEMKLAAAYPIVEGYRGEPSAGYFVHFEDPMQFSQLDVTVSATPLGHLPTRERFHADIAFRSLDWKLRYWHNDADFYDLFGPVERSRKGDAFIAQYSKARIYDPPRQLDLFASGAAYFGLDELPAAQNVASGFKTLLEAEAGARYTNTTKSLGAVDHEKGIGFELIADLDYAQQRLFPQVHAGLSVGVPVPIRNSSVWLYSFAGIAGGRRDNPLASFYFGGFRNNYVDDREVKRYRELRAFPGFEIDGIDAQRFAKATAEWNLPPLRVAEIGTPSLFLSSVRPAVFAGVLAADRARGPGVTYQDVGGQLDFNITAALRLPMTVSVGAASGFRDGHYRRTEVLASLKIM